MNVKAISVQQPHADNLVDGPKKMEVRSWRTHYRGPLLVCAGARPVLPGRLSRHAIGIVNVVDCRRMKPEDAEPAMTDYEPDLWVWIVAEARRIDAFPVKGKLGFFEVELPGSTPIPAPPQPELFNQELEPCGR